jgi:uncharacterized membrane protein
VNLKRQKIQALCVATMAALVLAACGSDSDDVKVSQPEAQGKNIGQLGALTVINTGGAVSPSLVYWGEMLKGFAFQSGGTAQINMPCQSGSMSLQIVKTAARFGLGAGDQLIVRHQQCVDGTSGAVTDGSAKLTAKNPITPAAVTRDAAAVDFYAETTGFSFTPNGFAVQTKLNGEIDASYRSSDAAPPIDTRWMVPAGKTFSMTSVSAALAAPYKIIFKSGVNFADTSASAPNLSSQQLNGGVDVGTDANMVSVLIKTPIALTGKASTASAFVPTAGRVDTTLAATNQTTTVTFSGSSVTLTADADRISASGWTATLPATQLLTQVLQ